MDEEGVRSPYADAKTQNSERYNIADWSVQGIFHGSEIVTKEAMLACLVTGAKA